jgi:hypothetical protein
MRPSALLATKAEIDLPRIKKLFHHARLEVSMVKTLEGLESQLATSPFVVFVDDGFDVNALHFAQIYGKKFPQIRWVYCLRQAVNKTIALQALEKGYDLTLDNPHEPEQYLLRSKQILRREKPEYLMGGWWKDLPHQTLKTDLDFGQRRPVWKDYHTAYIAPSFSSLEKLKRNYQELFRKLLKDTKAGELALLSLRADSPLETSLPRLRCLVHNEWSWTFEEAWNLNNYPEVGLMFDKDEALFVPQIPLELQKGGAEAQKASVAAIPIRNQNQFTVGVLRALLPNRSDFQLVDYLEDLSNFSKELWGGFRTLEFFSRIYAPDSTLYKREDKA